MIYKTKCYDYTSFHEVIGFYFQSNQNYFTLSLTLCIIGLGINGAMFPFYGWMPDLFAAVPANLSALLSSVTVKVSPLIMMKILYQAYGIGIYEAIKIDKILIVLGIASMISGSIFAIYQTDLKKRIAFSTISQLGYIYLAIGIGNEYGMRIGIYQLIAHSITKAAIYLSTGAINEQLGSTKIDDVRGIGKEMPITLICFSIAALSMVGIPILPGFVTKWNISLATLQNQQIVPIMAILLSAILNILYYFPVIINAFFGKTNLEGKIFAYRLKPVHEQVPLIILTIDIILLGLFSNTIFQNINVKDLMSSSIL